MDILRRVGVFAGLGFLSRLARDTDGDSSEPRDRKSCEVS